MILLAALVLSVLVAWARGGKLSNLAQTRLRSGWLAIGGFCLQIAVIYWPSQMREGFFSPHVLLLVGSQLLILLFVGLNFRVPGVPIMGLGFLLNAVVMIANGGYMPISLESLTRAGLGHLALGESEGTRVMATKDIILSRGETFLWPLSDVFVLTWPLRTVLSIGDVVLAGGACWFFQKAMMPDALPEGVTERGL